MESPHWLIIAGAVLLILGVIGKGGPSLTLLIPKLAIGTQSLRSGKGIDGLVKTVVPRTS
jgi:hypothetical protein